MSDELEPIEVVITVDTSRWDAAWEARPSVPPALLSEFGAGLEKVRRICALTADDVAAWFKDNGWADPRHKPSWERSA